MCGRREKYGRIGKLILIDWDLIEYNA